jgi:autotransporter-associated beta strand protein
MRQTHSIHPSNDHRKSGEPRGIAMDEPLREGSPALSRIANQLGDLLDHCAGAPLRIPSQTPSGALRNSGFRTAIGHEPSEGKLRRAFFNAIRALALAVSLIPTSVASAQTWDGGGSNNNWTAANNWNPNGAPVNNGTANVTFSGNTRLTPNVNTNRNINSLSFDSAAGEFVLGGSTLTINGGGIQSSATAAETININIVLGANQTWTVSNPDSTLTVGGIVLGSTSLNKAGAGTLTLSGANTYTGGTTVSGGILQGTTTSLQGNIANDANVTFDQSTNGTYAGNISGTGSLTKSGTGTVTLSGTNVYSGGTTVSGGILQGDSISLQGNIANDANVTFDQTTNGTYSGVMSGTGSLTKSGSGTLILSGANSFTGGTTVSGGILQGDSTSLQGDFLNNAAVDFNQTGNGTYAGAMSGTGSLTKSGSGSLTMSGTNTYSGTTSIDEGRLDINGSITSNATVNANGTLGGNGTIIGNVTNQGAIAAGNLIGTLSVNGNYTQSAGSSMQVEINNGGTTPDVNNDLVAVNGAATLNGGTVNVVAAPGNYIAGTQYAFLTATGGVTGAFAGATDNLAFLDAVLGYTGNSAYFTLMLNETNYAAIAQTSNEFAVATYLDNISTGATGDLQTVLVGLNMLTDDGARSAFNQMSGELFASLGQVGLQDTTLIVAQLGERIRSGTFSDRGAGPTPITAAPVNRAPVTLASYSAGPRKPPIIVFVDNQPPNTWTGWAFGFGLGGSAKSGGNATGLGYAMGGTVLGAERWLADGERLGFFGGYLGTQLNTMGPNQTGSMQGGQFGGYNYHDDGFNYYTLIGGLQFSGYNTQRFLQFDGIDRVANGDFSGWQSYLYLERGVTFQASRYVVQPYAALQYIYLRQNSFIETGANALNLDVAGLDANSLRSLVGGRLQLDGQSRGDHRVLPEVRALWLHEFLETASIVNSYFAPIGGGSFAVQGLNLGRDWALVGGGLRWESPIGCTLFANYDAQVNSQQVFHVGSAGLQFDW